MNRSGIYSKIAVFSILFSLAGIAMADTTGGPQGGPGGDAKAGWDKGACKADVEKLCAGVKPGDGGIRDCMKQHEADLSQGCKDNIAKMKEHMKKKMEAINTACKADEAQYCKDVTPGEGREMACLHAYNDKISAGCKDAMKSMHRHHKMGEKHEEHEEAEESGK
jgi:hypothetical protein